MESLKVSKKILEIAKVVKNLTTNVKTAITALAGKVKSLEVRLVEAEENIRSLKESITN